MQASGMSLAALAHNAHASACLSGNGNLRKEQTNAHSGRHCALAHNAAGTLVVQRSHAAYKLQHDLQRVNMGSRPHRQCDVRVHRRRVEPQLRVGSLVVGRAVCVDDVVAIGAQHKRAAAVLAGCALGMDAAGGQAGERPRKSRGERERASKRRRRRLEAVKSSS